MAKKVITKKTTTTVKSKAVKKPVAKKTTKPKTASKAQPTKRRARVRVNKLSGKMQSKELVDLECKNCGAIAKKSVDVISYTCWECTNEMTGRAELPKAKRPTGFPRGWAFMKEFVHADGKVYFKGVEQPKLRGTKKPTPIKQSTPKVKKSKAQKAQEKQELLVQFTKLKKEIKKEKRVTYRRKLETQLRKIEKKL